MEFSTLNGYKVKDKKAIRYYDTVADMKSDSTLKNGMYVKTKGYYEDNDGGHGEYIIVNDNELIEDNGSVHDLDNGLKAKLIIDKQICLKQFGAKNDEDVSIILQTAIDLCKEKYDLIVDDFYTLSDSINIDKPIVIKGLTSFYSNGGMCGFECTNENDITYFNFNEGSANCLIEHLRFHNDKSGTCIKFSSRDESLTNYRVWKNQFNKCRIENFNKAVIFYAIGDVTDYDYSSEMLFIDCKFYNNDICCEYDNTQSYNTNFIATDFESDTEHTSIGFLLSSYGGININGGSIILRDSLIKLALNDNLTPNTSYSGIINISNCRLETYDETVFNYNLTDRYAIAQLHTLNINNTNIYTHQEGTLFDCNVRGLFANCNISFTGAYNMNIYGRNQQGGSEYSKILINTPQFTKILVPFISGAYTPWVVVNNCVKLSCVSQTNNNNILELDGKILFGYGKGFKPGDITINVPWNIRKFVINVNGAFMGNSGSITITDGDSFTNTFNYAGNVNNSHDEIYLPYNADGKSYTISSTNIWGSCYFE